MAFRSSGLSRFRFELPLAIAFMVLGLCAIPGELRAETKPNIAGDYAGTLGSLHVRLHIKSNGGVLSGTLDSPDQDANGLGCADFHLDGDALSFSVPVVHG